MSKHIKISDFVQDDKNFNRHTDSGMELLKKSIETGGIIESFTVSKDDKIISGNALQEKIIDVLGYDVEPIIVETDGTRPVVLKRTDIQSGTKRFHEAALLANTVSVKNINLDDELIREVAVDEYEINIEELGIDISEDDMDDSVKEDEYEPDLPSEPKAQYGDIYQLGNHRLMCGDCTNSDDVSKLMSGKHADIVITDPPYNVNYEGGTKDKLKIQNDNMNDVLFFDFLKKAFENMNANMREASAYYIFHADSEGETFRRAVRETVGKIKQTLIWNKNTIVMGRQDYHWKHEPILYGWKTGGTHYFIDDRTQATVFEDKGIVIDKLKKDEAIKLLKKLMSDRQITTVINEPKPTVNELHPTMKPLKLIGRLIRNSSIRGDIVVDLFGGSGSTMIAAEQLGRTCYTMELDPKYVDVIIERWQQFTGKTAIKINNQ